MISASSVSSGDAGASRFASTLFDILDQVSYRRVRLEEQFDPIYRLRYEAYRREEFIPFNSQKISGDMFDSAPNALCYGVYIGEKLVSSIRLHHVTPDERTSPSRLIFSDLLDPWLDAGMSYLDPSRFTADHEASLAYPALPFLTTRIVVMASDYFGVNYCLSSVRPEHGAFYKRVFNSRAMSDLRYYPGLDFPVCMYAAEVPAVLPGIYRRFPFYRSTHDERHRLFGAPKGDDAYRRHVPATARKAYDEAPA